MKKKKTLSIKTITAHGLGWVDEKTRSIVPPIYLSTTYERNKDLTYDNERLYIRSDNPTYEQVGKLLTALENGYDSQLFSSGMSAATALFMTLRPGDHVVCLEDVYYGIPKWLKNYSGEYGVEYDFIANNDLEALKKVLKPGKTKIVWLETPSNPLWLITDIEAFTKVAHEAGAIVAVDNTVATPALTRPIEMGADIVMHSATKYLNGHSDVLLGCLICKEESALWTKIKNIAHDAGAIPGSFETWLLLRGIKTLFLRMEKICANSQALAEHFDQHPKIEKVHYPGLVNFEGHDIAKMQMSGGFGGMMSLRIKGGLEAAVKTQANTNVFTRATSLGSVDSLIEHRASIEGEDSKTPQNLLRLSIGIEEVEDLIYDLEQALELI